MIVLYCVALYWSIQLHRCKCVFNELSYLLTCLRQSLQLGLGAEHLEGARPPPFPPTHLPTESLLAFLRSKEGKIWPLWKDFSIIFRVAQQSNGHLPHISWQKRPQLAELPSKSATGCLYTAKISITYVSQIVKLSSHSDSAAAADDHDDRMTVPKCWLQNWPRSSCQKHVVVSIYRASQTFSTVKSIRPVCLLKYGRFGLPGDFLLGGGRQGLTYKSSQVGGQAGRHACMRVHECIYVAFANCKWPVSTLFMFSWPVLLLTVIRQGVLTANNWHQHLTVLQRNTTSIRPKKLSQLQRWLSSPQCCPIFLILIYFLFFSFSLGEFKAALC